MLNFKFVHVFSNFGGSLLSLLTQVTKNIIFSVLPSIPKACRPNSLQFRISFDVGIVLIHKL